MLKQVQHDIFTILPFVTQSFSKGGREGILFTEQRKQQGQDDTDEYGSGNRKVESKILFSNDDISRKSTHPRYFLSDQ